MAEKKKIVNKKAFVHGSTNAFYYDRIFENTYIRSSIVKITKTDSPNKGMIVPSITIMIKKTSTLFLSLCFGGAANFPFGLLANHIFIP